MTSVVACPARSECQHSWRRPGALVIIFIAHVPCRARKARVKVVLGTDAVAGAHGRYAEEFIYRVQDGGDSPMDALLSGTSVAAESLGMADRIGSLAEGKEADMVAVDGNPLDDINCGSGGQCS
jgi:imidazolonepropionase-like amidohydrolase